MKEIRTTQVAQRAMVTFFRENRHMPSFAEMVTILGIKSKSFVKFEIDKHVEAGIPERGHKGYLMKAMNFMDSRRIHQRGHVFVRPLKPVAVLRRFQRYIETSDWDEQIIRKEPIIDKICLVVVILSGIAISPYIVASFLK
jgi:hypothetical protein